MSVLPEVIWAIQDGDRENDGFWEKNRYPEYMAETEYCRRDTVVDKALVDELVNAIRKEGGWGEEVMDAMMAISPESFKAV